MRWVLVYSKHRTPLANMTQSNRLLTHCWLVEVSTLTLLSLFTSKTSSLSVCLSVCLSVSGACHIDVRWVLVYSKHRTPLANMIQSNRLLTLCWLVEVSTLTLLSLLTSETSSLSVCHSVCLSVCLSPEHVMSQSRNRQA